MSESFFIHFGEFVHEAKRAGWSKERVAAVIEDARSGDDEHALAVLFDTYLAMEGEQASSAG